MRAHSFSLEDGIIYLNGIPLKQNEVFGFLESGRMQMDNQEKENAELKQTLSYLCDKADEVIELKQRWKDFTKWVDNEVTFYIDMAMKNKKHVDSVEVLGNIWKKMEELSKEK